MSLNAQHRDEVTSPLQRLESLRQVGELIVDVVECAA